MPSSRRWIVQLLIIVVAGMAIAAGSALRVTMQAAQALAAPDQHTDLWYASNVNDELGRVGLLARKALVERVAAEDLRARLDVLYSLLHQSAQAPRVSAPLLEQLPEARKTLQTLAQKVQFWVDALASTGKLRWPALQGISRDVDQLQPSMRKAVADVHIAATNQADDDRLTLQRRYALLSWVLCGLLIGLAALVWRLVSDARKASQHASELAELNKQLETRVQERTQQLAEGRSLLMFILDASPIDVVLRNAADGRVIFMNKRLLKRWGLEQSPQTMSLLELLEDGDCARKLANDLDQDGFVDALEARISAAAPYWSSLSARLIQVDGEMAQLIWGFDISAHKALEIQLRALATTDPLSELNNRRAFFEKGERLLQYCRRYGRACAVLMIDIDHFKMVNDRHGHQVGDEAIRVVGRTLRTMMRDADIIGRIGGEEFSVLLPESGVQSALEAAERIRSTIEGLRILSGDERLPLGVTVSIGVSTSTAATESLKQFLAAADEALYQAKGAGRNRVVLTPQVPAETPPTTDTLAIV